MILPFLARKPSAMAMEAFVDEQRRLDFTYADVGATRDGLKPKGFQDDEWHASLGRGPDTFESARDGLRLWAAHHGASVVVTPTDAPLEVGQTVGLLIRTGGVYMRASCRIVWTVDEERRFGFGYGTLPGHPECGEESFVINWHADDTVTFDISAISKPRHPLVRLGAPVARMMQKRATQNYLNGMKRWVAEG